MKSTCALLQSYLTTAYRVRGNRTTQRFDLRIGVREPRLAALHARAGVRASAFITAWHPRSRVQPRKRNEAAQRRLIRELKRLGCTVIPGEGVAADGQWREPSVLALGLRWRDAKRLAHRYRQNAVVVSDKQGMPELAILRLGDVYRF